MDTDDYWNNIESIFISRGSLDLISLLWFYENYLLLYSGLMRIQGKRGRTQTFSLLCKGNEPSYPVSFAI